ncbi:MAG: hypothetical protein QM604_05475 [Microbacterium sp.]
MSRSARTLWLWFLGVHLIVGVLSVVLPTDVHTAYEPWTSSILDGGPLLGVAESWVYPQLALVPMMAAWLLAWLGSYTIGWAVMVVGVDAIAFAILLGRRPGRARSRAAATWLVLVAALGPVGLARIDTLTVPLVICALLIALRRPAAASALLTVGAWIKIWPAAAVAALWIALRGARWRIAAAAASVTALVALVVVALGGAANLLGFVGAQFGRGLQVESVAATPFMWLAALGVPGYRSGFNADIITFEVTGPGVEAVAALLTPLMAVAAVAVYGLGAWGVRRRARPTRLLPPLLLSGVLVMIVCNKVGSPQFLGWLIAPLVIWTLWDRHAARAGIRLGVLALAVTQVIFPYVYGLISGAHPVGAALLTVRNGALLALLAWSLIRLVRAVRSARPQRRG